MITEEMLLDIKGLTKKDYLIGNGVVYLRTLKFEKSYISQILGFPVEYSFPVYQKAILLYPELHELLIKGDDVVKYNGWVFTKTYKNYSISKDFISYGLYNPTSILVYYHFLTNDMSIELLEYTVDILLSRDIPFSSIMEKLEILLSRNLSSLENDILLDLQWTASNVQFDQDSSQVMLEYFKVFLADAKKVDDKLYKSSLESIYFLLRNDV